MLAFRLTILASIFLPYFRENVFRKDSLVDSGILNK